MEKLNPCPNCGGTPKLHKRKKKVYYACNFDCWTRTSAYEDEADARQAWNALERRDDTDDADNSCCVPYDPLPSGLTAQLQRLVTEERPGACMGCGFEHNCKTSGCAVLRKVSRIVAVIDGKGAEK